MKSSNIIKKLQKEGYKITFKKWSDWDGVPQVELDGFNFAIAEIKGENSFNLDFIFNHVLEALDLAKTYNPIIIKKIEQSPRLEWFYNRYLILNMQDYYLYKKRYFPYSNYYKTLKKLKKELE